MHWFGRHSWRPAAVGALALLGTAGPLMAQGSAGRTKFEISFPASAHTGPITGRVFVMISRTDSMMRFGGRERVPAEPREQIGRLGAPFFGRDVEHLAPGQIAMIDASDLGSPVESLREIPAGDYYVQALVDVYTEFHRADGHVVWMHNDQWEGQNLTRSPGNLVSEVRRMHLDPAAGYTIRLETARVLPPIEVPPDTKWVKHIKIQSALLTKFWGQPMYLGAIVLLPKDYETSTMSYPVQYIQGHFSLAAPAGFADDPNNAMYKEWTKDNFPRFIDVTFQHPTPYFDDSYAVNTPNNGPYGDAIMQELIPYVESHFRIIKAPWARLLSGGSTGGWESFALQIYHPDFFGGTWSYCPDPLTFTDVEGVDVYKDVNAFYKQYDWRREPTINSRTLQDEVNLTSQQRNFYELAKGTHGRAGEQLDISGVGLRPVGQGWLFPASLGSSHGRDLSGRSEVLERQHGHSALHAAQLGDPRSEAHREAARLRGRLGHVLSRPRDARSAGVAQDDHEPPLRRVLHVWRAEAALLDRPGVDTRAAHRDGRVSADD